MDNKWTSFNSSKFFAHIERWKEIDRLRALPAPVMMTVDLANVCNLSCEWCNASKVRQNMRMLSKDTLFGFADFLSEWEVNGYKVEALCIAGGGEPLCNPHAGEFMVKLVENKTKFATVTNGVLIDRFVDELLGSEYVAVSVDAGSSKTFNKYKGVNDCSFDKVISNMAKLCELSRSKKCNLGANTMSNGVNYRMLLYHDNIGEIVQAARIAQEIGCKNLHIRPASVPYDGNVSFEYSDDEIRLFYEQVEEVNRTKRDGFGFHYTLDKFNERFEKCNDFKRCYGIFITATLMPASCDKVDAYTLNLCCDRRSDPKFNLITNGTDVSQIANEWGGERHWRLFDDIVEKGYMKDCPRCTYYTHNKIFENCIEENRDNMLLNFI